jgi:hypothetical protein
VLSQRCEDFLHNHQGRALRARQAASLGTAPSLSADHQAEERAMEREDRRRGQGWRGIRPLVGGSLAPLPLARQRTGAGRCRHAVSPAPARWRSPPSRPPPVTAPAKPTRRSSRAGQPNAAQRSQSRSYVLAALRALHRDSDLPRQDRRLAGGRHYRASAVGLAGGCSVALARRPGWLPGPRPRRSRPPGGAASSLRRPVTGA